MLVRVRVLTTYQEGTDPTGTLIPVLAGNVQVDSTADVWSTLDLTTYGEWGDLITPYGNELFVERGIDYGNGDKEWVPLGYFRIDTVEQEQAPGGTIRVTASDRMAQVIDQRLPFPVQYPAGTSHEDAFDDLIVSGDTAPFPDATVEFDYDASASTFGASHLTEDSRYDFLRDTITPDGKLMHWDHRGVLVVRAKAAMSYVVPLDSGDDGVVISLRRDLGRDGYYNGVAATGESTDPDTPPPFALITNDALLDPLRWGGRFGKIPRYYTSSFITTTEQAERAAESILADYTGLPYSVDLTTVPNPALQPGDIIRVTLPGGFVEDHVIESLSIPLNPADALTVQTRAKSSEDIILAGFGLSPFGIAPFGS